MASSILEKYSAAARAQNLQPLTVQSRKWFAEMITSGALVQSPSRTKLLSDSDTTARSRPLIGKMYMFMYDPKHKLTLPYYDRFPLIILVDRPTKRLKTKKAEGFYGLNLHYLRPYDRAVFLSRLVDAYIANPGPLQENTRLRLSYNLLKAASKMKAYRPTFKHYLPEHIKSLIVEVPAQHWETAVFLPTQQFKKAAEARIWSDSRKASF
jgi:hypothetical protein